LHGLAFVDLRLRRGFITAQPRARRSAFGRLRLEALVFSVTTWNVSVASLKLVGFRLHHLIFVVPYGLALNRSAEHPRNGFSLRYDAGTAIDVCDECSLRD
jgi:hypothetical protein